MTKKLVLFAFILSLVGCNKPDPNPEKKDPIYSDLIARASAVTAELNAERKALQDHEKTLTEVIPQTGQIKYAKKRVYETQEKIQKLEQEEQYLKLKILDRARVAKKSYLAAFKEGKSWPDPAEYESYRTEMKLRSAKTAWDVKERMKDAGLFESPGAKASAAGAH